MSSDHAPGKGHIRVAGSWVEPTAVRHRSGGTWQDVQEAFVRSGSRWIRWWPPRAPETVSTFNALSSNLWHDYETRWFGWGEQPEQGAHPFGNHRGMWFYGNRPWGATLDADGGRQVVKAEIYLTRIAGHLGWGSSGAIRPRLWYHRENSRPSGRPAFYGGPHLGESLERNQSRWVTLPSGWHRLFENGTLRGVGVLALEGGPVSAYQGPHHTVSAGRIRLTHR